MSNIGEQQLGPTMRAIVAEAHRITPEDIDEVRHITLRVEDPDVQLQEGQSIGVAVPGPHPFGNPWHLRRYSIAAARELEHEVGMEVDILVRRCFYIDEISGERHPGIASNYLCDAAPGAEILLTGPYRNPFIIPRDKNSNLLMIGTGTGIAPFRVFIRRIYERCSDWSGQIRLFYGTRTGLDQLYLNDRQDDLANYYDDKTFKAFRALAPKPLMSASDALEHTLRENAEEVWDLVQKPETYVYLAGLEKAVAVFDNSMAGVAGSEEAWKARKEQLREAGHWAELIFG